MSAPTTLGPGSPGIDEAAIRALVDTFNRRVRDDVLLRFIFERAIGVTDADWAAHLALLCEFWSSVMSTSGRYHGNPKAAHLGVPDLEPKMFRRWLALFRGACHELFAPAVADAFIGKAERIAASLQRGPSLDIHAGAR